MPRISLALRKEILYTYGTEKNISYRQVAKRYKVSDKSVKNIVERYGEHYTLSDMPKSGRKKGARDPKLEEKLVQLINKNPTMSLRDLAVKGKTTVGMIQRVKRRNNLKTYKKQKVPKKTEKQIQAGKIRVRKLYRRLNKEKIQCVIMDDETYVKFDFSTLPGPQYYTKRKDEDVDDSLSTIKVEKFGEKALIWQAICSCGLKSKIFVTKGTINAETYQQECLVKRLIPFYKSHEVPAIFWPDLASAHYAKTTVKLLKDNGVEFVQKDENPANAPELRPIERYWALTKRKLRKSARPAKNLTDLKKKWISATRSVTKTVVQNLMKGVKRKIRQKFKT